VRRILTIVVGALLATCLFGGEVADGFFDRIFGIKFGENIYNFAMAHKGNMSVTDGCCRYMLHDKEWMLEHSYLDFAPLFVATKNDSTEISLVVAIGGMLRTKKEVLEDAQRVVGALTKEMGESVPSREPFDPDKKMTFDWNVMSGVNQWIVSYVIVKGKSGWDTSLIVGNKGVPDRQTAPLGVSVAYPTNQYQAANAESLASHSLTAFAMG